MMESLIDWPGGNFIALWRQPQRENPDEKPQGPFQRRSFALFA